MRAPVEGVRVERRGVEERRNRTVTILVGDRRGLLRAGLRESVEQSRDLALVGEAHDYAALTRAVAATAPDVLVLGQLDGRVEPARVAARLRVEHPAWSGRFLLLSDVPGQVRCVPPDRAGVLLTSCEPEDFRAAVRMLAAGYSFAAPSAGGPAHGPADAAAMTERELDVLRFLARGRTNAEISKDLSLSESTVKSHVQNLLNKLNLRNRVAVVIYAYESRLVEVGATQPELSRWPVPRDGR
ncbi:Transcriptional regulatory protein LiaR [Actinomadura rubteroloni]|uniref:Transcriptional regulatory protein LiaR n=1 Tax=Actinomadura rubteroloni TaxID=1926885 RepID=A0A2P4UPE6_9ACTN|nr:response regulator transcription factor [Actinomadura rubteroloni]POM26912.1 Transcriptional regulatory protein LiaR [Actinomadura rubteroloni]